MNVVAGALAALAIVASVFAVAPLGRPRSMPWHVERDEPGAGIDFRIAATTVAAAGLGVLTLGPPGIVAGPAAVAAFHRLRIAARDRAARAGTDVQLADAVGAISAALRSGMSVPQAFVDAGRETSEPLRHAFATVERALEVGVPLHDAVDGWVDAIGTDEARLVGAAIELHRRSGGDVPMVLDQVGVTIRERVAISQEVRALTAQARLSGVILGCLPIGFFGFLWLTSRSDMQATLATPAGAAAVAIGLILELAAFIWIRHLLEVT